MTQPRCRESADSVPGTCEALSTSCIPFGSAGTIGIYLRSEDTFIRVNFAIGQKTYVWCLLLEA